MSIFSNSSHLEWRAGLSDIIVKVFGLIWFSGFRGKDLNVIFYQNMPNLHNRYKSAERKISQKNPEYMLNYSFPSSCSRRRFKCESLQHTTDGRTDDDGRQVMAKAVLRNFDIQTFVIKTGNLLVRGKLSFPF